MDFSAGPDDEEEGLDQASSRADLDDVSTTDGDGDGDSAAERTAFLGSGGLAGIRVQTNYLAGVFADSGLLRSAQFASSWADAIQAQVAPLQKLFMPQINDIFRITLPPVWADAAQYTFLRDLVKQTTLVTDTFPKLDLGLAELLSSLADANSAAVRALADVQASVGGFSEALADQWEQAVARPLPGRQTDPEAQPHEQDDTFLVLVGLVLYVLANAPGWIAQPALGRPLTVEEQIGLWRAVLEVVSGIAVAKGGYRWARDTWATLVDRDADADDPPPDQLAGNGDE